MKGTLLEAQRTKPRINDLALLKKHTGRREALAMAQ
jgi:hypothetical protein